MIADEVDKMNHGVTTETGWSERVMSDLWRFSKASS